jgi:hypothetical protein
MCNEHDWRSSWLFTKEAEKPILVFGKNIPAVKFIFQNTRVYIAGSRPNEQTINSESSIGRDALRPPGFSHR